MSEVQPVQLETPQAQSALEKASAILDGKPPEPKVDVQPTKPVEEAPKDPKQESAAARFAALAKREKGIVAKQQDFKAREQAFQQKEQQLSETLQRFEGLKKEVADNPLRALEYLGVSYQQLTDFILKGEKPTPELQIRSLEQRMDERLKKQEDDRAAWLEEQKQSAHQETEEVIEAWRNKVSSFIDSAPDDYELIRLNEGKPIVESLIEQSFHQEMQRWESEGKPKHNPPKILGEKEAADKVEEWLAKQVEANLNTKKFKAKATPQPKAEPSESPAPAQPRTITNNMTSSMPSTLPAKNEADRMARALAKLSMSGG